MIYVGAFYVPPNDTTASRSVALPAHQIVAVIPWADVPHRLRSLALDRARPTNGQPRTLVVATGGEYYASARKFGAEELRRIEGERDRKNYLPFRGDDHHLKRAGFLPVRELAQATGYSRDHLRLLARQGRCGAQKHGGQWWMHQASLEAYANQRARHGRRGARSRD